MDIILKERGHGKTSELIYLSAQTGNIIVSATPRFVKQKADELQIKIPEPISPQDLVRHKTRPCGIYIDELSFVLNVSPSRFNGHEKAWKCRMIFPHSSNYTFMRHQRSEVLPRIV